MLPFKAIVALLSVGAVSTLPASHAFDKRATACKSGDKNFKALRNHKVDGSAFCSAYLQITRTSTITPVASTAATKWVTKSARMVVIQRVHFIVKHISRLKVMRTAVMTLTKTKTASVTSFRTKTVTGAQTDKIMKIDTYQVTKTDTDQFTKRVTRHFTTTVTAIVYTTSTKDITSTSTLQLTEEAPTTITVTSTEKLTNNFLAYNCGVKNPITARYGFARNFALHNFDSCKRFCSGVNALSFAYSTNQCLCFSVLSNNDYQITHVSNFADYTLEPLKRAVKVNKRVPAYLPLKDDKDVSRACSCHITNKPAAPVTSTIIAPNAKAVTVTSHTKVYDKIKKRVTVTFHRKIYLTNFKTTTKTDYITMTVTNRRDAMVTHPVIVTVTHVKTVTITNVNSVQVTNYNTVYTTKFDTASETDTETEIVTDVEYFTVTEYETIPVTVTKAEVIVPSPVTVFMATTTNYG
ncbi:hypothetical protein FPSE_03984 [Fusarium pseudograminearum CS3096]|uniref:Apple domain-containing protein n=1 Tax=Fusarium pseudograminearum (strain CS3096) TaxID=1028729 RepID=K3VMC8_FUSPC|nr:hypothetical protein FPSE_03984 [Fusarium pseudograminearum CS3096]EKJ75804.1 hypothetical protein FPSE_03984 [Fusarium pseudograminearum CS3096]